jgi:MtrB/PioB family decaheme-associated outer membrane protein
MKTRRHSLLKGLAVFALLLLPAAAFTEDKPAEEQPAERGMVEFGVRYIWGDVYGRPDLRLGPSTVGDPNAQPGCLGCGTSFDPSLKTSKYNEYRDLRNGFFIRRFNATFDNILNSKNYVSLQSQKTLYRDQSYLATFGQYGKFRVQFRYDEIPHTYSDTVRTLFTETAPGVWTFPTQLRQTLQATSTANLPSLLAGTGAFVGQGVVTNFNFLTPSIIRKAGTASVSYNMTPDLNFNAMFWRESQNGLRPIGLVLNSSPSAGPTSGYGVELPETISYFNNLVRVGAEYGKQSWAVQGAYVGSFFQNKIDSMVFDNPFNFSLVGAGTPQRGQMDLYPDNQAHYLNIAGASDVGKWLRLMASVNPGWLRQDDAFLPYTTNSALTGCGDGEGGTQACTSPPSAVPSLKGAKQTLAMNYTLVTLPWKKFQFKATYRHYDYNNNTPVHTFTPTQGDVAGPSPTDNEGRATSFNRKNLQLTGNWYFAKRSSAKFGYEAEWMDRTHRDVEHSLENSFFGAVDVNYWKDLVFRFSYRHSNRTPDEYQDETSVDAAGNPVPCTDTTTTFFTGDQRCSRRFDEAKRIRNRADGLVQYTPIDKLTLSAFGGTIQDDYNHTDTNSPTPLNFPGATVNPGPYYLYGILKDISYNYGFGADYAVSPQVTLFAEYSHEHYYRRLISRYRAPTTGVQTILTCNGCDTANNDWESTTPEKVDIWTVGADTHVGKKAYFTTYYSLAAAIANTFSRFLGDPTILAPATTNRFLLVGATAATDYPESFNRQHEVVAVFKYKLSKSLWPKVEYRYQQFDNADQQTSAMTQYMGCVSGAGTPGSVAGCPIAMLTSSTSPTATPVPGSSPFYPSFVVGDTSASRYLFLGVDQPSYHAHYVAGTLEYHF